MGAGGEASRHRGAATRATSRTTTARRTTTAAPGMRTSEADGSGTSEWGTSRSSGRQQQGEPASLGADGAWQQECSAFGAETAAQSGAVHERAAANPRKTAKHRQTINSL